LFLILSSFNFHLTYLVLIIFIVIFCFLSFSWIVFNLIPNYFSSFNFYTRFHHHFFYCFFLYSFFDLFYFSIFSLIFLFHLIFILDLIFIFFIAIFFLFLDLIYILNCVTHCFISFNFYIKFGSYSFDCYFFIIFLI